MLCLRSYSPRSPLQQSSSSLRQHTKYRGPKGGTQMNSLLERSILCRRMSPFHVQVELVTGPEPLLGPRRVQGRVVQVFRGDGRVVPGDQIAFRLWVCEPGKEPTGECYVYRNDFIRARYIEAYLHGSPPKCEIAGNEFTLIDSPSQTPCLTVGDLEELVARLAKAEADSLRTQRARNWWQFWKG
jgi:hypothetical protein